MSQARRKLLGRLRTRKGREREGLFLVEGIRAAEEALAARAEIAFALLSPRALELGGGEALATRMRAAGVELHEVEEAELASLSDTEAPQGVLLVCHEPIHQLDELTRAEDGAGRRVRLLLLDAVQDPGNAGTLVRAAAAFALDGVVALDGTVDLFNPKVVRASAGGVFRIPLVHESWERVGPRLTRIGVRVVTADTAGEDVAALRPSGSWALVVGSEGAGVRRDVSEVAYASVRVPMPGGVESLNAAVAGSILLYMMTQERDVG